MATGGAEIGDRRPACGAPALPVRVAFPLPFFREGFVLAEHWAAIEYQASFVAAPGVSAKEPVLASEQAPR